MGVLSAYLPCYHPRADQAILPPSESLGFPRPLPAPGQSQSPGSPEDHSPKAIGSMSGFSVMRSDLS